MHQVSAVKLNIPIEEDLEMIKPLIIRIACWTTSGKTTFVLAVVNNLNPNDVTTIQYDSYYRDNSHLSLQERENVNFDHPDALETELLGEHLKSLMYGKRNRSAGI